MDDVLTAPVIRPPVGLASGPLGAVQAADREIARQTAVRARAVAAFAASRPASADRVPGSPGAMSAARRAARPEVLRAVSEWAAQELVVALSISTEAAELLLARSLTLVHRLPLTVAALEAGALHVGHLAPLLDEVAPIADDAVRATLERDLLAWMSGRVTTPAQLSAKARREVLERDARDAADDLLRAVTRRGVSCRPDTTDGMAVVSALLTTPEARALTAALGAYADALPDDGGTRGQTMADCLLDLVLCPGEHGLPPVQVTLDVVAPVGALLGGDQPCEIDGQVVPAEMVRALLAALTGRQVVVSDSPPADSAQAEDVVGPAADGDEPVEDALAAGDGTASEDPGDEDPGDEDPDAGFDDPIPVEVLERWAAEEDALAAGQPPPGWRGDPPAPGWWREADRAVDDAGRALLGLDGAMGHARRMVATAERADATDEAAWADSPAGRVTAASDALAALAAATDDARHDLADLLARTAGGGLADRPRLVLTDPLTGALLALTDLPALTRAARDGGGLAVPGGTDGYRPGAALDRHVRARDRRCRFPGCRRRPGHLDHCVPWPHGRTTAANLTGYCESHHRGKHQAPGWRHHRTPDGTLAVTTPTGLTAGTQPPPY